MGTAGGEFVWGYWTWKPRSAIRCIGL